MPPGGTYITNPILHMLCSSEQASALHNAYFEDSLPRNPSSRELVTHMTTDSGTDDRGRQEQKPGVRYSIHIVIECAQERVSFGGVVYPRREEKNVRYGIGDLDYNNIVYDTGSRPKGLPFSSMSHQTGVGRLSGRASWGESS